MKRLLVVLIVILSVSAIAQTMTQGLMITDAKWTESKWPNTSTTRAVRISGTLNNTTNETYDWVKIEYSLYDKDNVKQSHVFRCTLYDVTAGEKRAFTTEPPYKLAKGETIPYTVKLTRCEGHVKK